MARFFESTLGVLVLLFVGLIAFSSAVVCVEIYMPGNEKLFGFLTGIAGMFSGSFFTWLKERTRGGE